MAAYVGKYVLENLTTGMYDNPLIIYREYVQNCADSIDDAISEHIISKISESPITIQINYDDRSITILDTAKGLSTKNFESILTKIADSDKGGKKQKGFRGIGRLAGIAYCDFLIFEASAKGEPNKSVMTLDAAKFKESLSNANDHIDAVSLFNKISTITVEPEKPELHYFKVTLKNVSKSNDELLNTVKVKDYLSQVLPVPYSRSFLYRDLIYDNAKKLDLKIDEYIVNINGTQIFKPYSADLYDGKPDSKKRCDEVTDLKFYDLKAPDTHRMGWMWIGLSNFEGVLKKDVNPMAGIRIRKENIQIGDTEVFTSHNLSKELRTPKYFIGEIFVTDENLIPNGRRDYFESNETCKYFENEVNRICNNILQPFVRYASETRNALKAQITAQQSRQTFLKKEESGSFVNKEDREKALEKVKGDEKKAETARAKIQAKDQKAASNDDYAKINEGIKKKYGSELDKAKSMESLSTSSTTKEKKKPGYKTQELSQYNRTEKKLISQIYGIIQSVLNPEQSEMLINKIQESLKKSGNKGK